MSESVLVYGIVLGAAVYFVWRFLPASLKTRVAGPAAGGSSCGTKGCGSEGCDGCH